MTREELLQYQLESAQAFIALMFGQGPDCIIPETVRAPIGVNVKVGKLMNDIADLIGTAKSRKRAAP